MYIIDRSMRILHQHQASYLGERDGSQDDWQEIEPWFDSQTMSST